MKRLESHRPFGPVDRNVAKRALELFIASSVISPCGRDHHDECSWLDPIQIYENKDIPQDPFKGKKKDILQETYIAISIFMRILIVEGYQCQNDTRVSLDL